MFVLLKGLSDFKKSWVSPQPGLATHCLSQNVRKRSEVDLIWDKLRTKKGLTFGSSSHPRKLWLWLGPGCQAAACLLCWFLLTQPHLSASASWTWILILERCSFCFHKGTVLTRTVTEQSCPCSLSSSFSSASVGRETAPPSTYGEDSDGSGKLRVAGIPCSET